MFSLPVKKLFASIPATSASDIFEKTVGPVELRTQVLRTPRASSEEALRWSDFGAAHAFAGAALLGAVLGRVRSPHSIVAMLSGEGRDVPLSIPEDACEVTLPVAMAICMDSKDRLEMGSAQWVWNGVKALGPRVKAVRSYLPRKSFANFWATSVQAADPHDEADACDMSEGALGRGMCMEGHDPLSIMNTQWVLSRLRKDDPKKSFANLWATSVQAADPHDEADACDMSEGALGRGMCMEGHDPLSIMNTQWVLSRLRKDDEFQA